MFPVWCSKFGFPSLPILVSHLCLGLPILVPQFFLGLPILVSQFCLGLPVLVSHFCLGLPILVPSLGFPILVSAEEWKFPRKENNRRKKESKISFYASLPPCECMGVRRKHAQIFSSCLSTGMHSSEELLKPPEEELCPP